MREEDRAAVEGVDEDDLDLAELFQLYRRDTLYSLSQLAKLTGIPKRTLANWAKGVSAKPREWQRVVRLVAIWRLDVVRANRFLRAARIPSLQELAERHPDAESQALFEPWAEDLARHAVVPSGDPLAQCHTREDNLLREYLQRVRRELSQLPTYYPHSLAVTFELIRQEVRLAPLRRGNRDVDPLADDAAPGWSACRHTLRRVMLLGKPGAGKTWLLKTEALQQIKENSQGGSNGAPLLPLYVRLPDLAAHLSLRSGLDETLAAVARSAARLAPDLPEEALVAAMLRVLREEPARVTLLLDGLDEVPLQNQLRATARHALQLIAKGTSLRFWVTTRLLGYAFAPLAPALGPDVVEKEILPLRAREIGRAVRVWFHGRPERFLQLQEAMRRVPALILLASNPLLLSMICMLADVAPAALVGSRDRLLVRALLLLLEGGWRHDELRMPEERVRRKLQLLEIVAWCFATHSGEWAEEVNGDVLEEAIAPLEITRQLAATWRPEWDAVYEGPLWELSERDGILVKGYVPVAGLISEVPYRFVHQNIQELLVARYLVRRFRMAGFEAPEVADFLAGRMRGRAWTRVLLLMNERLVKEPVLGTGPLARRLAEMIMTDGPDPSGILAMAAGEMVTARGVASYGAAQVATVRRRLLVALRNPSAAPFPRVHAGRLLAALGDPRQAVLDVDALDFMRVEGGPFLMGSDLALDADAAADELPQRPVTLPTFRIARYPISNAQFRQFLEAADGFDHADNWHEAIAAGVWRDGLVLREVRVHLPEGGWEIDLQWLREPQQSGWPATLPNHPATGLTWYDARAFVRWLETRYRVAGWLGPDECFDLPSEAEFEKAMRGIDGRLYPWGNRFDRGRLNWHGLLFMASTPIGAFPHGASSYGVEDMAGGLWEWTRTLYAPYDDAYGAEVTPATPATAKAVQRGGCYYEPALTCRCAARTAVPLCGGTSSQFRVVWRTL